MKTDHAMLKTLIQPNGIGHLVIDMPGRSMNVLEPQVIAALSNAFEGLVADPSIKGIVVSSGKPSFVAGADLAQMKAFAQPGVTAQQVVEQVAYLGPFFRRIETCGKPVVAAASGMALGGGLELMLTCHYRIAANVPTAQFGLPEVKLGLLPGAGGTQRLPRLIGIAQSIGPLTSGASMGPSEALKLGILDAVVEPDRLLSAAEAAILEGKVNPIAPWDRKGWKIPGGDAYAPANGAALMVASAQLNASTRGNYPAPITILRCIHEGTKLPIDRALKLEMKLFATLVQGSVAQNLIRTLFFAKQSADKLSRRPAGVPRSSVSRLGILGAGFMGQGVAQVSACAGIDVVLVDREIAIAERARQSIDTVLEGEVQKGRLGDEMRHAALGRIHTAADPAAFKDCDLVIEAVVEDVAIKAEATKLAEVHLKESAIFASNTSALPIGDLSKASRRPANFIGLHFFSPVAKMALVEVVVGSQTSEETLARALDFCRQIKKTPIVVGDGYGFFTTRCIDAYIREGIRLLVEGVRPALIENAAMAIGMPLGPLALADEVGIDVLHHIAQFFRSRESGPRADDRHSLPNAHLESLYDRRRLGRKTSGGFYDYPAGESKSLAVQYPVSERQPAPESVRERLLISQVLEAAHCWADGVVSDVAEADLGAHLGLAFPSYLGGPFAFIDDCGAGAFVEGCDRLAKTHGARFEPPAKLRQLADQQRRLYA